MNAAISFETRNRNLFARAEAAIAEADVGTKRLEDLAQFIRETMPNANSISETEINREAGVVIFIWRGWKFVAKPSFEVFELKGTRLFITGASILIQTALHSRKRNERTAKALMEAIDEAEQLVKRARIETGMGMLRAVKQTLRQHAGVAAKA